MSISSDFLFSWSLHIMCSPGP